MAKSVKKRKSKRVETVSIKLPKGLVDKANSILEERGTDIQTYLRLTTLAFTRNLQPLGLEEVINFGQYRDQATVEEVCRVNPKYILWLVGESKTIKFQPEVIELALELSPEPVSIDHILFPEFAED